MTSARTSQVREEFLASVGFALDEFQLEALDALDEGRSVLVAAPTGSGKTVVAEYAVARALAEGGKAFYTTPLKALSNQKYGDLLRRHGAANVGLLTGDNAVNGDAPVVVMTTEVLRNMIYAGSPALQGLRFVVLDEVHYLQNAYRGPVWEEVIVHLAPEVALVGLSATVSNAEEVADWIATVRGETTAIIEEQRPVDLTNLYLVGDRHGGPTLLLPTFVEGRPNGEAAALDNPGLARTSPRGKAQPGGSADRRRLRLATPRRAETVLRLRDEQLLPAIFFIFSRNACDEAVQSCLREGVRLTTPEERRRIRAIAERHVEPLSDADLRVLEHGSWLHGLENGLAAHHAGLVPPFKEAVEECFAEGLIKVVFATETLAMGINMPARSVVIEKLTKFTGERHDFLTPGEYTQLTGRAGRRGIDEEGYAVVLWSPFVAFEQVAGLASNRTYAISSSFRPTYNMAANLVRRYPADEAHHLLNLSFAQYRADRDVVLLEAQLERAQRTLGEARAEAECDRGDVWEYRRLVQEAAEAVRMRPSDRAEVLAALDRLRPGDVLVLPGRGERAAILTTARRKGGEIKVGVLTSTGRHLVLAARDFPAAPHRAGTVDLPRPYQPDDRSFRDTVAGLLRETEVRQPVRRDGLPRDARGRRGQQAMARADAAAAHPCATCPDLRRHLKAAERADRAARDADRFTRSVKGRSESLARQFDRVLGVLAERGCVDGWSLTEKGRRLARTYHECDLLVVECLDDGVLDGLSPPEVAALVSCFTFETRGPGTGPPVRLPTPRLRDAVARAERLARRLQDDEQRAGLPHTRLPDPGFAALAHGWASGRELERLLEDAEVSGGDFVRNVKTLVDLLRQLGESAPGEATRDACSHVADVLFRGVVAASSVLGAGEDEPEGLEAAGAREDDGGG